MTGFGRGAVAQRLIEPAAEFAAAHRAFAAVEHRKEREAVPVAADRARDFEVAAARRVDHDEFALVDELKRQDEGHHVDLRLGRVVEKRIGGGEHFVLARDAPGVEVVEAELLFEELLAVLGVKVPVGH